MKSITSIMVLVFACLTASGLQAEIYSWTDENGVKHYSHTPPADRSVPIKTASEIQPAPTTARQTEKINAENIDAILEELDREKEASTPGPPKAQKPPSRQERIQQEQEKLEDKIQYLEGLPPHAFANTRSRQAIIGRYQYRLQQLLSNPDEYFKQYGY